MPRSFCIPGIVFLFCAFVLLFLVSISLPFIPTMDIVRAHFNNGGLVQGNSMFETRFGIWAACWYVPDGTRTCLGTGHAYQLSFSDINKNASVIIAASWTRGLAIHPVACAVTFIALLMSFSQHITVTLVASITSFLAALITLIAFAVDIALYAFVHHELGKLPNVSENTNTAPGFWMTFASLILLLLAGCTVCFGRRRDRMSGSYPTYPSTATKSGGMKGFFSRFRRN